MWGRVAVGVVQGSSRGGADSRRQGLGENKKREQRVSL